MAGEARRRSKSGEDAAPRSRRERNHGLLERLRAEFQALGLSSYESRVLPELIRLGQGDALQVARASGVPRTSTYQVLESLATKGLAERVPGVGPQRWMSPGKDEVVSRLQTAQEERLNEQRRRAARLKEMLADVPESPAVLPFVRILPTAAETRSAFQRLFVQAQTEVVAFSRPPYSWEAGRVNQSVIDAVKRGVSVRAIYPASHLDDPDVEEARRSEIEAYLAAGVQARVAEELPIKLIVADRRKALVAMTDDAVDETGYPTNLLIEHEGFAAVQADAFESAWSKARPHATSGGLSSNGDRKATQDPKTERNEQRRGEKG